MPPPMTAIDLALMPLPPDQKSANYADIDNKSGLPHALAILQH
jgi:hypothetical protein